MLVEMSWGLFLQWSRRSITPSILVWKSSAVRSLQSSWRCSVSSCDGRRAVWRTVWRAFWRAVWEGGMGTSETDLKMENKNKVRPFGDNISLQLIVRNVTWEDFLMMWFQLGLYLKSSFDLITIITGDNLDLTLSLVLTREHQGTKDGMHLMYLQVSSQVLIQHPYVGKSRHYKV